MASKFSPPSTVFDFSLRPSEPKKSGSIFNLNNKTFVSQPSQPSQSSQPSGTTTGSTRSPTLEGSRTSSSPFVFSASPASRPAGMEAAMAGLKLSDHKGRVSRDSRRDSLGARLGGSTSSSSGAGKSRIPTPPSCHGDDYDDSEDASDESSADGCGGSGDEEGESSSDEDFTLETHLGLLERRADLDELNEIKTAPIFTDSVRKYAISVTGKSSDQPFTQFGLIAGDVSHPAGAPPADPRIFYNVSAPSSVFICGSQGSGKSHSLSCLLENCLIPSEANTLPRPLTGIVFHFDTFISDNGGSPCEAAWLSSSRDVKVRVLCAPTNVRTIRQVYHRFPNVKVEELRLSQLDLNTKRMLDLMAVTSGNMPLYLHVVNRILRDLRITQQKSGKGFDYTTFKRMVQAEDLTKDQLAPLKQRLDTLESFMVEDQAKAYNMWAKERSGHSPKQQRKHEAQGTDWTPEVSAQPFPTRAIIF